LKSDNKDKSSNPKINIHNQNIRRAPNIDIILSNEILKNTRQLNAEVKDEFVNKNVKEVISLINDNLKDQPALNTNQNELKDREREVLKVPAKELPGPAN